MAQCALVRGDACAGVAGRIATRARLAAEAIRALKQSSTQDISVGGAELATQALEANLIDELHFVVHPLLVGGGKPALRPSARRKFGLVESRSFDTGAVYLRYRVDAS